MLTERDDVRHPLSGPFARESLFHNLLLPDDGLLQRHRRLSEGKTDSCRRRHPLLRRRFPKVEENRLAEVMVEITRVLSSSLNTEEVLLTIVSRLREVLEADECSIVRLNDRLV